MLGDFLQGQQAGQANRAYRNELANTSRLDELAPKIVAGDPSAFAQGAAINPKAAAGYQEAGDSQMRKLQGFMKYVDGARATGNMAAVNAALSHGAPFIEQLTGKPGPTTWTDDMVPGWDALKARVAMAGQGGAGNNVQSTYINAQGKRVAIMRDGSQQELGDANQSIRVLEQEGALPYGVVTSGGVAGQVVPLGGGQQQPMQQQAQPQGAYIDPSLPPEVQAQIRQSLATGQEPPGQMVFAGGSGASGPVRTPTAGEKAAATERAKQEVQLQYLPQQQAIETQGAIERAVGTERGKAQVEREAAAPGAISTMQASLKSIDELLNSPDLGDVVGLNSINPLNRIPGSDARGLIARSDQIAGQAFLAAFNQLKGGGAITEREGAAATAAMARLDRSQSLADYKTALSDLKGAITPAIERQRSALGGQQQGGGQQGAAIRIQSADDYNRLPPGALYISPDGMQRRKR